MAIDARFRPGWKLSLFTLLLFPAMLWLGFWQLEREQEKRDLQRRYDARAAAAPLPLEQLAARADPSLLSAGAGLQYLAVSLRGRFDNERLFLLDNRVRRGRAGFEVIAPFYRTDGGIVLVNRGWVAQGSSRQEPPAVPAVRGEVEISGQVYVPPGEAFRLGGDAPFSGWPRIIQAIDAVVMLRELGADPDTAFPYTVRLGEGEAGALVRDWPVVNLGPERHRGYAVQWFSMAAVLLLLYLYAGIKSPPRQRD